MLIIESNRYIIPVVMRVSDTKLLSSGSVVGVWCELSGRFIVTSQKNMDLLIVELYDYIRRCDQWRWDQSTHGYLFQSFCHFLISLRKNYSNLYFAEVHSTTNDCLHLYKSGIIYGPITRD